MKRGWLVTLVLLSMLCGTAEPGAQASRSGRPAPIADPCTLLTQAEASAAIGAKLAPGQKSRAGIVTRCTFSNAGDREQEVVLDVQNEAAPDADSVVFESYLHLPDAKPIAGLGDKALWTHDQVSTGLVILKNGRLVEVTLPRTIATMTPPIEKAAKLIASRMPA